MKLEALQNHQFPLCEQTYTNKDSMLYALGLGYGADPLCAAQLQYLYEDGLKMVPSMAMVLGHPGMWSRDPKFDVNWVKLLHAEQHFEMHKVMPPAGSIVAKSSFIGVKDKGADKGALVFQQKKIHDASTDELLATVHTTLFLRGDGGCGDMGQELPTPGDIVAAAPAKIIDLPTLPQAALIYRLSGDWNPIHADPQTARKAGFERPILHGLCTMGLACRAVLEAFSDGNPDTLKSMYNRFSRPVYPGETIRFEFFEEGHSVRYRARALERDLVVLDRGEATFV